MYMHLLQCGHMKVLHVIRSRLFQAQELQNLQASVRQAQCAEGWRQCVLKSFLQPGLSMDAVIDCHSRAIYATICKIMYAYTYAYIYINIFLLNHAFGAEAAAYTLRARQE